MKLCLCKALPSRAASTEGLSRPQNVRFDPNLAFWPPVDQAPLSPRPTLQTALPASAKARTLTLIPTPQAHTQYRPDAFAENCGKSMSCPYQSSDHYSVSNPWLINFKVPEFRLIVGYLVFSCWGGCCSGDPAVDCESFFSQGLGSGAGPNMQRRRVSHQR